MVLNDQHALFSIRLMARSRDLGDSLPFTLINGQDQQIFVKARSFTEAIEEAEKAYGRDFQVVGVWRNDCRTVGPRDLL